VAYPGETVDIRAPRRDGTIRVIKADANTVLKNTQNKNKSLAMHTQKYKNRIEELEDIIEAQKKRIRRLKRRNAELEALIGTEEE
jgi:predicted RNase H-like nuclease (RuvC/YqgF family)